MRSTTVHPGEIGQLFSKSEVNEPFDEDFVLRHAAGLTINDSSHGDTIIVAGSGDTINVSHATIYLKAGTTNTTVAGNGDIIHVQNGVSLTVTGSHDTVVNDSAPEQVGCWSDHQSFNFSEQGTPNNSGAALAGGLVQAIGDRFVLGPHSSASQADLVLQGNALDGHQSGNAAWAHDFLAALTEITGTTGPQAPLHVVQRCSPTRTPISIWCSRATYRPWGMEAHNEASFSHAA